jgi:hypothetical protein
VLDLRHLPSMVNGVLLLLTAWLRQEREGLARDLRVLGLRSPRPVSNALVCGMAS